MSEYRSVVEDIKVLMLGERIHVEANKPRVYRVYVREHTVRPVYESLVPAGQATFSQLVQEHE